MLKRAINYLVVMILHQKLHFEQFFPALIIVSLLVDTIDCDDPNCRL